MKIETQRKVEALMFWLQTSLVALYQLEGEGFYKHKIKNYSKLLIKEIESMSESTFKSSGSEGVAFYVRLMDWLALSCAEHAKFDKLSEASKVKYLMARDNFNTVNLR